MKNRNKTIKRHKIVKQNQALFISQSLSTKSIVCREFVDLIKKMKEQAKSAISKRER